LALDGSGKVVPAHRESFPVGSAVTIAPLDKLEDFRQSWRHHHPLEDEQMAYAGSAAQVAKVGFYHGGDVLYTLEDVPGIWHEGCLMAHPVSNAV
jgi:hypothetical protein